MALVKCSECGNQVAELAKMCPHCGVSRNQEFVFAVQTGNIARVKELLRRGADVNAVDQWGLTGLIQAVITEQPDMVKFLLTEGADINAKDPKGESAVDAACVLSNHQLVEILHLNGAVFDMSRTTNYFLDACRNPYSSQLINFFLDHGIDTDCMSTTGMTPLMIAARAGNYDIVKLLLERGAEVNRQDKAHSTALAYAIKEKHVAVAELLLEHGAEVDIASYKSKSALEVAEEELESARRIVELLQVRRD